MYDSRYSADNRMSETQIAIDAVVDEDLKIAPVRLIAAPNNTIRYGLKLEIKAARDTNTAVGPGRGVDLDLASVDLHGFTAEPRSLRS